MIPYNVPINAQRMTIGVQGENNVREFLFDVTEWRQLTGDIGTAEMVVQRNGDSSPYATVITMKDENTVSWVPTEIDTAKAGAGKIELMWIANNQTIKTKIFLMKVDHSLPYAVPDDSLDPWASWMPGIINADANYKGLTSRVDDIQTRQTSPYNFKGSVSTLEDLPETAEINDTYYVQSFKYRVTYTGDAENPWQQSSMNESDYEDELDALDTKGLLVRSNLTANDDADTLTEPGTYYKGAGIEIGHGVNTNSCRILVLKSKGSNYANAQLWFDAVENNIYYRVLRGSAFSWPDWKRLVSEGEELLYHADGRTEPGGIGVLSGQVSGYLNNPETYRYHRCEMQYTCSPGAIIIPEFHGHTSATQLAFYFYDVNNAYLASTTHTDLTTPFTVPNDAYYFKLTTYDAGGTSIRDEHFSLHSTMPISPTYNPNIINTTDGRTLAFTYQTGGSITSGRLMLPPNYDISGGNVPLVVFAHGSGGMVSWDSRMGEYGLGETPDGDYYDYLKYLTDEGFAVFDCYPWTKNKYVPVQTYSPYLMPLHITSYLDGIKYVCSRFNVDIDRVSVLCTSQGGHFGQWAYMQSIFPFKCVALFAPATGIINTSFYMRNARKAITLYTDFDCTDEELDAWIETNSGRATNALVQSFNAKNKAILLSFCPMTQGITNGDLNTLYNGSVSAIASAPQWLVDILGTMPTGASNNYSLSTHTEFVKNSTVPCKFWAALDDEEAPAYTTYAVYTWLTNGGSDASFRILPTGTGGHHATDNSPLALKQSGTTALGISYTDVPTAYVEAVEFIRYKRGG